MYLVFSSSPTPISLAIRIATKSTWSHVDMMWDDGTLIGAVATAKGPYKSGVQKLTLKERLAYNSISTSVIARCRLEDENAARVFAEAQVGKSYDWGGVLSPSFIYRDWQEESKWFCSELFAMCAKVGKTRLFINTLNKVTPQMIYTNPLITLL